MRLSFYWGPLCGVGERGWSLWGWKMEAHGSSWVLGFSNGLVASTLFPYLFMFSLFRTSILTRSRKAQPPPRTITSWPFHILGYSGFLFTWDYMTAISYFKFPFKESVCVDKITLQMAQECTHSHRHVRNYVCVPVGFYAYILNHQESKRDLLNIS